MKLPKFAFFIRTAEHHEKIRGVTLPKTFPQAAKQSSLICFAIFNFLKQNTIFSFKARRLSSTCPQLHTDRIYTFQIVNRFLKNKATFE